MATIHIIGTLKRKLIESGGSATIPLQKGGGVFTAMLTESGIVVDNLGLQPKLPWAVFEESVALMTRKKGRARKGNAMNYRLGEPGLPLDSIEGHIASVVYGKKPGDSVFRRITPIANILIWAGICEPARGGLILKENSRRMI
jgi:hypothetical protein